MSLKTKVSMLTWLTVIFIIFLLVLSSCFDDEKQEITKDEQHNKSNVTNGEVDVLLFGYARGGSTYVGHILGYNEGAFYFYEPLWTLDDGLHYFHNDQICEINTALCRHKRTAEKNDYLMKLKSMYACCMETFENIYVLDWHRQKGGKPWNVPKYWHNKNLLIQRRCKKSKNRVAKVLRITGESVLDLLSANSKLKVVYLYRDPRGIVNSRLKSRYRPRWNVTIGTVKQIADGLCQKMDIDSEVIFRLKEKYPKRIFPIAYETIVNKPRQSIKDMYNFLDLRISEKYLSEISVLGKKKHADDSEWNSVFRSDGVETAIKWRRELSVDDKQNIDKSCTSVYKSLGYKAFALSLFYFFFHSVALEIKGDNTP